MTKLEKKLRDKADEYEKRAEAEDTESVAYGLEMAQLAFAYAADAVMYAHLRGELTKMEADK